MKPEVIAGTKLQLWQEIMRQQRYNAAGQSQPNDPIKAAEQAEQVFSKLCATKPARRK